MADRMLMAGSGRNLVSMRLIDSFRADHYFLSNFSPDPVEYDGDEYPTLEHAFQAAKTKNRAERRRIMGCRTPLAAKHGGGRHGFVTLRADWEDAKLQVMLDLLRVKFSEPTLADRLLGTGDVELAEGNTWGDRYWGTVNGHGDNQLGRLLMQVRDEIRDVGRLPHQTA